MDAPEVEEEGYLFGKRMLEDLEEEAADLGAESGCPFAGLAKGMGAVSVATGESDEVAATEADGKLAAQASTQ